MATRYEVGVGMRTETSGNQTVAIFYVYDDGETDPEWVNPPDAVLIASLKRAIAIYELQAAVAAGEPLKATVVEPGRTPVENT